MSRYEYVSQWQLAAPRAAVWAALTEVESWPQWWPYVKRVQTLRRGDAEGVGAVRRIDWSSRLPYGFTLDVECIESARERRLVGHATGNLEGIGTWELSASADGGTAVRYTWALALNTRWMRIVAPLASPVFRWNHEGVMRGGYEGLTRRLLRRDPDPGLPVGIAPPRGDRPAGP